MSEPFFIPRDEIREGDRAERDSLISEELVSRFSALIGDTESFHVSDESAARTVFGRRIAHAVHLASYVSTLIGQALPGFGTIYCSQTYDFKKPVYLNEMIRTEVVVLEKLPRHRLRLRTTIYDSLAQIVMEGEAVVKTYQ